MSQAETRAEIGPEIKETSSPCDHCLVQHGICFLCGSAAEEKRYVLPFDPLGIASKMDNTFSSCDHPMARHGICCRCGRSLVSRNGLPYNYIAHGLRLSPEFVASIKKQMWQRCSAEKKLYLVLDLDNTLIHVRKVSQLPKTEEYLVKKARSRDDLWRIKKEKSRGKLIKLRPFVREFLREANELFTMSVYTKGCSRHTECVLKLLDPEKIYFGNRVITRSDGPPFKTLNLVLADERGVVIVDDMLLAWRPTDWRNLVQIERYEYFKDEVNQKERALWGALQPLKMRRHNGCFIGGQGSDNAGSKSYAAEKRDESEDDGPLASALGFLKKVHKEFFDGGCTDVRPLLLIN